MFQKTMRWIGVFGLAGLLTVAGWAVSDEIAGECPVTGLSAEFRDGQVFLRWKENDLPQDSMLSVHRHSKPITDETLSGSTMIGHHIQPSSARNWWRDPASFGKKKGTAPVEPVGFVIGDGLAPLNPASGLFVHTVVADEAEQQYYAVTASNSAGKAHSGIVMGQNSLRTPVSQRKMPTQAIWAGEGAPPSVPADCPAPARRRGRL